MDKVLLSSNRHDWETPPDFFAELDKEFHFTLDPCAEPETAKCAMYYTKEDDGLAQNWGGRPCFAILHTADSLESGSRNVPKKADTRKSLCSFRHELIQRLSMSISTIKQKSGSLKVGCISELTVRIKDVRLFRVWWWCSNEIRFAV